MIYKPLIKICGITNLKDALVLKKYGVDIMGLIFAKSPRRITIKMAKVISDKIKNIKKMGVFVNEKPEKINRIVKKIKLDFIQLAGNETVSDIKKIKNCKIIKVLRPKSRKEFISNIKKYKNFVYGFLIDTYKKDVYGGTGEIFNWEYIKLIKKENIPFFVAGGLNPFNIKNLILKYKPFAIDINSGVEEYAGKKSEKKIKLLFENLNWVLKKINKG